jgi:hypothetical protein
VTQQTRTAPPVVYLDAGKNLDKTIDLARFGARKDRVNVVIQRTLTTKKGDTRRIPILEITSEGNVMEIPAPRLRTPISALLTEADLAYRAGHMNIAKSNGHARFAEAVKVSRDYMAAKAEHDGSRKQRRQNRRRDRQQTPHRRAA